MNQNNAHQPVQYKLFVLRMWRASPQENWHLAIQPTADQHPQGLTSIQELMQFIQTEMEISTASNAYAQEHEQPVFSMSPAGRK